MNTIMQRCHINPPQAVYPLKVDMLKINYDEKQATHLCYIAQVYNQLPRRDGKVKNLFHCKTCNIRTWQDRKDRLVHDHIRKGK